MPRVVRRRALVIGLITSFLLALPSVAFGSHAWGNYHWARAANPLELDVVDNMSSTWDPYLDVAIGDWDWPHTSVLDLTQVEGTSTTKSCKAINGKVDVCNGLYGNTGWLGIAQIWVRGSHITRATARMNDTYFNSAPYNDPDWRQYVVCQEVGHDFGLDHQDENFDNPNLGTCMDYTDDPNGPPDNRHPNQHDYDQLEAIYFHLDGGGGMPFGLAGNGQSDPRAPAAWGRAIDHDLYVASLRSGERLFTFVIWVR